MKLVHQFCIFLAIILISPISMGQASVNKPLAFFVGHSQWNKGSQGKDLPPEWDYCRAVGDEVVRLAPQYGIDAKMFYRGPGDYEHAVDLMHKLKRKWSPIAPVISCHYNETPVVLGNVQKNAPQLLQQFSNGTPPRKGSLFGTLVLYKPTPATKQIASCLLQNVTAIMPRPENSPFVNVTGIIPINPVDRGADEILAPVTTSPVLILEIGYGDNQIDSSTMRAPDFKTKLATAILKTYQNNQCNPG